MRSGDTAQVQCIVVGDSPQITWTFQGHDANKTNREGVSIMKIGQKSSILSIEPVTASHAGNYSCRASNNAGIDEYTATLIVNGIVKSWRTVLLFNAVILEFPFLPGLSLHNNFTLHGKRKQRKIFRLLALILLY